MASCDGMPEGYIPPNTEPKCAWSLGADPSSDPHIHSPKGPPPVRTAVLDNVLEMIGNTPLVRLDKIARSEGLQCDLLGKCEFFNAGGSVKDRIGLRMIEEAERDGIIKPGDTIIEPTSGNTGIGLALASAVKGYKCVICMPEKMSNEKVAVLRALGARIVRTPTSAAYNTPESHVGVAWRLKNEIPNSHILDQYRNVGNPMAHYDGTGAEILAQTGGQVDMIVVGSGTGGTVAGIGRKVKEVLPSVQIISLDPYGSILARPEELNETSITKYHVEGIGYDFIPTVLDHSVVDKWYKCEDKESFAFARRLIREEGLLCGGSSGAAVAAAVKAAKGLKAGQKCVVILPDSIRNYITKFVDDKWMVQEGLLDYAVPECAKSWWAEPVTTLSLNPPITITAQVTCAEAIQTLKNHHIDQMPILGENGDVVGMVTVSHMTSKMLSGEAKPTDPVSSVIHRQFEKIDVTATLGTLSRILDRDQFAIITRTKRAVDGSPREHIHGIATSIDLLDFMCKQ